AARLRRKPTANSRRVRGAIMVPSRADTGVECARLALTVLGDPAVEAGRVQRLPRVGGVDVVGVEGSPRSGRNVERLAGQRILPRRERQDVVRDRPAFLLAP